MKKLFTRFRNTVAAGAIALAALGGNMVFTTPAYANNGDSGSVHDQQDEVRRAFANFDFVPGQRWYRLSGPRTELPASIVAQVEEQIGSPLCKRQNERGEWESNLKVCPTTHPQMNDSSIGLLNPRRHRDGPILDFITQNHAYNMPTELTDLPIARAIDARYTTYLAARRDQQVQLASADTGAAAPTLMASADTRSRRPTPRTQVARTLPANVPLPVARPVEAPAVIAEAPVVFAAIEPIELQPFTNLDLAALAPMPSLQLAAVDPAPTAATVTRTRVAAPVVVAANTNTGDALSRLYAAANTQPAPVAVAAAAPVQGDALSRLFASAATNDNAFPSPLLQLAANDSSISAADQMRTAAVLRNAPPKQENPRQDDNKGQFALAAANDRFKDRLKPGNDDDAWVTPRGRKVQFEVFENGRFRASAPMLMAA